MPHPAAEAELQLLRQCEVRRQRRSGPGGQHRNKVETAIVLTHQPTGIQGSASERRSQAENQRVALGRLRINLALEFRLPAEEEPSPLWKSRTKGRRLSISETHADFPVLLAELLDFLHARDHDLSAASLYFQCTRSQLVKFLEKEPRAMLAVKASLREKRKKEI